MSGFSPALIEYLQQMDKSDPLLTLLEIDAGEEILRLVANNEDIVWQGHTYTKFAFMVDMPSSTSDGSITTLPLRVCNIERVLRPYLDAYDGGVGLPVTITLVNPAMIDEDYSELRATLYNLSTENDSQWVYFTLGPLNPLNKAFPPDQYISNHCRFGFKNDPRCGYSGLETECDRSLDRCRELNNSARFGGHPGLDGRGLRLV